MGEPIGVIHRPWLAGLTHFDDVNEDFWDVVYSYDHVDGVAEEAIVTVYTDDKNHETLEADPDIERIDNRERAAMRGVIQQVNPFIDERSVEQKLERQGRK